MNIQVIPHEEIDKVKWNSCVHYATNGNVFGYKWYLDTVAKEWDALVEGDYESIMPLFITEKTDTLKQPTLLREAGIYSINMVSPKRARNFIEAIPTAYNSIQLQLNEGIQVTEDLGFELTKVKNHQMVLLDSYAKIAERYSPRVMTALKQLDKSKVLPSSNVKPEKIAQFFKDFAPESTDKETAFHAYQRIMYNALHRGWGATFGATDENKKLLSAAFFIYSQGRMMRLVSATSPEGESRGAFEYLMDNIFQSHAGRPLVLDFNDTSEAPRDFGAQENFFYRMERGVVQVSEQKKPSWKFW